MNRRDFLKNCGFALGGVGIAPTAVKAATNFSDLSHLEGEMVSVYADGLVHWSARECPMMLWEITETMPVALEPITDWPENVTCPECIRYIQLCTGFRNLKDLCEYQYKHDPKYKAVCDSFGR